VSPPSSTDPAQKPSSRDALQALLAFSALHTQIRHRRALAGESHGFEAIVPLPEFEPGEQFVLDEVLQLVAERAVAITGADGLAIALAENNEIVLRASAGMIKPDLGVRIDRNSAFSGACFRHAQVIRCDDTETDDRVNRRACRLLGARSMVAVPLCGRRRVIGLLEAFSSEPFGFNDSDIRSLQLLAELVLGALRPEDEDRFAESAQVAADELNAAALPSDANPPALPPSLLEDALIEKVGIEKVGFEEVEIETVGIEKVGAPRAGLKNAEVPDPADPVGDAQLSVQAETSAVEIEPEMASIPSLVVDSESTHDESAHESISVPSFAVDQSDADRRPGVLFVLVMVVISALAALAGWWKLSNAQLGKAMLSPAHKIAARRAAAAPAKPPAPGLAAPSSAAPPAASSSAPTSPASGFEGNLAASMTAASADAGATSPQPSKLPRMTGIRHWSSADGTTVVLDLEDQVQYEAHRLSTPDRIYFDLHDTALPADLTGKTIEVGDALLSRIRIAQPLPGLTRVVLETRGSSNFSVSLEPNPYRLVVQIRRLGAQPQARINLFPGSANQVTANEKLAIIVPPPTREDLQLRAKVPKMRVVVDAGHGGWDLGTVGRRGLLEKDLVLEIAQRLAKLLESRLGTEVILTRSDDNYIPLDERAEIANQSQADLFVSVHANYSDLPSARGVETYYTNFFAVPGSKEAEARDNGSRAATAAPAATLSPAELHDRIEQSRRLAASVQRSLYATLSSENPGLRDRGVKEASYVVLTETSMPGILAEVSFVSSPTDEQKLRNDGYREQIAEALYKGIARYAATSRGVKMASAAK
jgi:N-acetylmuramoyl-L-alanine amidase/putative methionine-R-sulfoxide reductase with GAF domain